MDKDKSFTDGDLQTLKESFNQHGEWDDWKDLIKALIARLEAAELKECNQYHCGHHGCNAWRKSKGGA